MDSYYGYRLLVMLFIIGVNAFFAAAEVSLLSVRQSKLKTLAAEGQVGAQAALSLLANPERLLSVVQVGVTLASLGLGWAGEKTLYGLIFAAFDPIITPLTSAVLHGLSFLLAFLLMTYAHVVIGEVVPKNIAYDKADRLAVIVAPALLLFYKLAEPLVFLIERSSSTLSRIIGVRGDQAGGGHSTEELKLIISTSAKVGHLRHFEADAARRLLELQDYAVREIMVPRNGIVSVPIDAKLDEVLHVITESQYSRLPVYDGKPENIVGLVHYKDLLPVWQERRRSNARRRPVTAFQLKLFVRKALVVPETKPVNQLIDDFRNGREHMAMVVDEFGTIVGLVTIEDVFEQIFGEIEDEHDEIRKPLPLIEAPAFELDGGINIRDLEMHYGIEVPTDAGFETLAGFLLYKLGRIPEAGDTVEHESLRFTIVQMQRNRVALVRVERMTPIPGSAQSASAGE
ncbi:MAG: hemolysin family protein [Bryobacteraceae bacterium]